MNDELAAARLLLARLGIEPEQLLSASTRGVPIPTVGAYLRNVAEAVPPGTRRVYDTYWARVAAAWVIAGLGAALAESAFGDVADDAVAARCGVPVEHPVAHQPFR
jgi:hypothetical protein